jgi:hypothetical protein
VNCRVPLEQTRRDQWVAALQRMNGDGWKPAKCAVVCYVEQHLRWVLKGNLTPQTLASLSGDTLRRILLGITTHSWYESLFAEQHGSSSACRRTECNISSFDSLMQSVIESYVDICAFYLTNSFNCEEPARIGLRPKLTHNLTQQHV